MVSVSGIDIKFGRIIGLAVVAGVLIFLYKHFGSGPVPPNTDPFASSNGAQNVGDQKKDTITREMAASPVVEQVTKLELKELSLEIKIEDNSCRLTYLEVTPESPDVTKPSLLLLHGAAFNAATWNEEVGTMAKLKEWNYRAVALNLKELANNCSLVNDHAAAKIAFLSQVVAVLKLGKIVLVSPSKSGEFSIPYVVDQSVSEKDLVGYIPIAPVIPPNGATEYTEEDFVKLKQLPTLIVQGRNDTTGLDKKALRYLSKIPNNEVFTIENAGHACYLNKPKEWHVKLQEFLQKITL